MKICSNCNSQMADDMRFCQKCGTELDKTIPQDVIITDESVKENKDVLKHTTAFDKIKAKILELWGKMDLFSKILTIISGITILQTLVAFSNLRVFPIIFSIFQIAGVVVSFLLYKNIIKTESWIRFLVIGLSAFFVVINISSYSWTFTSELKEIYLEKTVNLYSPYDAKEYVGKQYKDVVEIFKDAGFENVDFDVVEDLKINESSKDGLVENVIVNDQSNFDSSTEFKKTSKVLIKYHTYEKIKVPYSFDEAKVVAPDVLIKTFSDAGFVNIDTYEEYDLDPDTISTEFENHISIGGITAFNGNDEFPVNTDIKIVTHRPYEKYKLKVIIDFVPNLIFNKYNVKFEVGQFSETLLHGKDAEFEIGIRTGKHMLSFHNEDYHYIDGNLNIDVTGDTEISLKITCYEDTIKVEKKYIESKGVLGENEAFVPMSSFDCMFENYEDIQNVFEKAGFENIYTKILYDIVLGWTQEGEVERVSIDGDTDFERGDIFNKNAEVVITYHMKEVDDPNRPQEVTNGTSNTDDKPVSYSTNNSITVKNGDNGVYSYKSRGGTYKNYYIVDFDEGYVYCFSEGNGDDSCIRGQINSGDLNSVVVVDYVVGNEKWSEELHFKWKNQPDHLIMQDHNGFEWDFYSTNLEDALLIKAKKKIMD